jgi:hypothetical protein
MPEAGDLIALRDSFEAKARALIGRSVRDVTYWDIRNSGPNPRTWDQGEWHHAVMGVELLTSGGPASLIWTNTFFPYGVEVFHEPMTHHVTPGPDGPEGWRVENHDEWASRVASPILRAAFFWETFEVGPSVPDSGGLQVGDPQPFSVPTALRLDFDRGPVWFVVGMPMWPDVDRVFIPADEIVVVFSGGKMRAMGFADNDFLEPRT